MLSIRFQHFYTYILYFLYTHLLQVFILFSLVQQWRIFLVIFSCLFFFQHLLHILFSTDALHLSQLVKLFSPAHPCLILFIISCSALFVLRSFTHFFFFLLSTFLNSHYSPNFSSCAAVTHFSHYFVLAVFKLTFFSHSCVTIFHGWRKREVDESGKENKREQGSGS